MEKSTLESSKEKILTADALHRKLASDIIAPFDLPGFTRAAMDGFAVVVSDTFGATDTNPRQLKITGSVEIGDQEIKSINPGQAVRISTGAPLPDGANGVIKIEDCEIFGDTLEFYTAIPEGKNIASSDEDVKKGELVLPAGTALKPWDIGMLEALAIAEVEVEERLRVATLSTGNELIESGKIPHLGQVVDSNRPAINSWLKYYNVDLVSSMTCKDEPDLIRDALISLSSEADLVITTGGTSVGSKDYLAEVIEGLGELWVHGIAIRPGKPVALGSVQQQGRSTTVIALPGYPLAAFLNFHLFASFLITKWTGQIQLLVQKKTITLADKVASKVGVHDFVRLKRSPEGAKLVRITGAGILSSIVHADYLLEVPTTLEGYNAGDDVEVYVLR